MTPNEQPLAEHASLTATEPLWITLTLWPFRIPIVASLCAAVLFVLALFCCMIAVPLESSVAWGLCALFGLLAAIIAAATALRYFRATGIAAWGTQYYPQTTAGSTIAIMALLVTVYSWFLTGLLHGNFFVANRAGGVKYFVTVAIAMAASLYLSIYGRRALFAQLRRGEFGNMRLNPWQAVLAAGMCLAAGAYFAWLMI